MKLLLSILLSIATTMSFGQGRQDAKNLSEKLTPKYTNDNTSMGTSYLFDETNPNGFDLLSANVSFSDKNQTQKIGFAPFRLSNKYIFLLSNLRINLTHTGGALTSGLSVGNDNAAFESKRVQKIFNDIYAPSNLTDSELPIARPRRADETLKEYMEYYNTSPEMKAFQDKLLANFDSRRLKHVFKYSVGYNIQFFPVLKSESAAGNFDSLNYHATKANNYFAKGSYSFKNGFININGGYNYFNKRKAADSIQPKRRYDGFTFGASIRIPIMKKENLVKKDFYKNSLFVPGIYVGFIYDRINYKGAEAKFAEDNTKYKATTTITLDFSITPAAQFRLAFPIQKSEVFNTNTKLTNNIAILQYNFKLINLNDN
ncbi:hypothetical protein ACFOWM_05530 [Ferruginibacter yonginensis]|uniref:Uncharacterized protein n=1 Tax=Ferruginibacter yonginensis TaxID=1310416 RepID=A0ABV8QPW2_9BACT